MKTLIGSLKSIRTDSRSHRRRAERSFRPDQLERFEPRIVPSGLPNYSITQFGRSYQGGDITVQGVNYNPVTETASATFHYSGTDPNGVSVSIVAYSIEPQYYSPSPTPNGYGVTPANEVTQDYDTADTVQLTPSNPTATVSIQFGPNDCGPHQVDLVTGGVIKDLQSWNPAQHDGYGDYDLARFNTAIIVNVPCSGNLGLSPGYWKNHTAAANEVLSMAGTGFQMSSTLAQVFPNANWAGSLGGESLAYVLANPGGGPTLQDAESQFAFQAVASYLNAAASMIPNSGISFTDPGPIVAYVTQVVNSGDRNTITSATDALSLINNGGSLSSAVIPDANNNNHHP